MPINIITRKRILKINSIAQLIKKVRRLPIGTVQIFDILTRNTPIKLAKVFHKETNLYNRQHPSALIGARYLQPMLRKNISQSVRTKFGNAERFVCVDVLSDPVLMQSGPFGCLASVSVQFTLYDKQGRVKQMWGKHIDDIG